MEQIDLKQLVEQYPEVLTDHTKLKAYILDLYPNCKRGMVNILVAIQQCGIVAEMQASKNSSAMEMSRWKKCLEDDVGFTGALAETCLQMWCSAIGIREGNEKTSTAFVTPELQNSQKDWFEYDGSALLKIKEEYKEYEGEIYIPDSVISIGKKAFYNCKNLTNITIPDSVESIGDCAFLDCVSLASVTIGSGVMNIGKYAFCNCDALESIEVDIENTTYHSQGNCVIETISKKLLFGCNSSVIPSDGSVISIGEEAFCGCKNLTRITIGSDVTNICDSAFENCTGLSSVTIENSVIGIGKQAFFGCTSLTNIIIPDSVTSIGDLAFFKCASLTTVTIGNGVMSIGKQAFVVCTSLVSVEVGSGNTMYHSQGNCVIETTSKKLIVGCKTSVIPNDGSVTSIGEDAFSGCTGLTSIMIPNRVKNIDKGAFYCCSGLKSIMIPARVRSIGESAFSQCRLKEIQYAGTKAQWKTIEKGRSWNYNTWKSWNDYDYNAGDTDPYIVRCKEGVIPQFES